MGRVRGLSLVELLVASAILMAGLVTIFGAFSAGRDQVARMDALLAGQLVARMVLDRAVHRFRNSDPRYYTLTSSPSELVAGAASGAWKRPFTALAQSRTRLVEPGGELGELFTAADGIGRPRDLAPEELRFWAELSYEVRVYFGVSVEAGAPSVPIDSDGNGVAERDMARVEVEVYHGLGAAERSVCRRTTLLTAPDRSPGAGVLVE